MTKLHVLEGDQLQQLARIIRNQEVEAIKNIVFKSEIERTQYLRHCKDNFDSVIKLLNDANEVKQTFVSDQTRSPIAHNINSYILRSVNFSLQAVKNYTLRMNYITKIREHSMDITARLQNLNPMNVDDVSALAEEAVDFRNSMLNTTREFQSPASRNFSKWIKESGVKFGELLEKYQGKRGFAGPFKTLTDQRKLLVYNDVIVASGRGSVIVNILSKVYGGAGVAVLIFIAGMMVWDIFSSEHIIQTATYDAVVTVASIGGAMIGEVVGVALPSLVGIEASPFILMATGIIGGFAGAFVIGTFVGWLIDLFFESGGSAPLSTDGHHCYVASLPDGEKLARQIAHQHQLSI